MVMYEIEKTKTKRKRRKRKNGKYIVIIIIMSIILIPIAISSGIKLAEHVNNKEEVSESPENKETPLQVANENSINNENSTESSNITKLTSKQLKTIDNIYEIKGKVAFLTFDDGPSGTVTPKILDTLKNENIKATFFVLGTMVKSNPEILKREQQEGHYIANHGYSHVYSKVYENYKKPLEEYNKTNKLIQKALNDESYQSNIFRFPGGSVGGYYDSIKTKAKKYLKENGVAYLDWNCLTNDSDGAETKQAIMRNLKATCRGKNSIVVLMHDAPNKDLTAKTLPDVISYLRNQGYDFKNLYDII